ncbi:hypothetical protein N7492_003789 [Penicillium capsulatum]|uniref:Manganese lipoxygenase n=1 Tax=Penicillium capsulatum TaxID=69766 RepID=A0A9W9LXA1_9EURO|nr:hypothetical protein N7492_003789 [Penicillium capsulatum]
MVRNLSDLASLPGFVEPPSKLPEGQERPELENDEDYEPPINDLDTGALVNELMDRNILPKEVELSAHEEQCAASNPESLPWKISMMSVAAPKKEEGFTYRGNQLVLTKVYDLIEQRRGTFDPIRHVERGQKKYFVFTNKNDGFPPHLNLGLNKPWARKHEDNPDQRSDIKDKDIFNPWYLIQLYPILNNFRIMPGTGTPADGPKISDVEKYNREQLKKANNRWSWTKGPLTTDIFSRPNVGELDDWYSDDRFGQQQFTGTNPTTIQRLSKPWLAHFRRAAKDPKDELAKDTINKLFDNYPDSFYMQDYSNFRRHAGFDDMEAEIQHTPEDKEAGTRYGCAAVCLFFLDERGLLHPLAIVTDWRDSTEASVTIYNRELFKRTNLVSGKPRQPSPNEERVKEADDWPWRYAKTCVQTSDWFRHEVSVHLTRTHLVEEAVIVSANRQFDPAHPVFKILRPHWQKTLALNASARQTLVPAVVLRIVGFNSKQALQFIQNEYKTYDFEKSYVPTDLYNRGFPPKDLDSPKFRNYTYARCVNSMWNKIRTYVEKMLALEYGDCLPKDLNDDARKKISRKVATDESIANWCSEMRHPDGADLPTFPKIETFDSLVDCVTMCIHIASPQHTAVNYLQDYYQGFVINKPSCLFAPPPTTLEDLLLYKEEDLTKALPIKHRQEWLLASHVPFLLSFKPNKDKETLRGCIDSARKLIRVRDVNKPPPKWSILNEFCEALDETNAEFQKYANEKWDADKIPYNVLETDYNAVSILI